VTAFLDEHPEPSEEEAREAIAGNLCRCTGYQNIVASVLRASQLSREITGEPAGETAGETAGQTSGKARS